MKQPIKYYTDASHGWFYTTRELRRLLKIDPTKISEYSYQSEDGDAVYLEEDSDGAYLFMALKAAGLEPEIQEIHSDRESWVTRLKRYNWRNK
jgi:hypothetical protein